MKGKMNNSRQGKIDTPNKTAMSGKGGGVANKRDSAVATGTPNGSGNKVITKEPGTRGNITRSKGSFKSYR